MKKILLIETSSKIINQIQWALSFDQFHFFEANTYQESINLINNHNFDLIFLDTNLPNEESYKLLKTLNKNTEKKHIPIFLLTTLEEFDSHNSINLLSATDYFIKPFINKEISLRAKKHLKINNNKILIIDSSEQDKKFAKKILSANGFEVYTASNTKSANIFLQQFKPHLVLLETKIAKENNPDFYHKLSQAETGIIYLSTTSELDIVSEFFNIETNDFLLKPLRQQDLILRVKKYFINKKDAQTKAKSENTKKNIKHFSGNELEQKIDTMNTIDTTEMRIKKEKEELINQIEVTLNHEIRNPLTSILIGSQALKDRFPDDSDEKQVINGIENCSQRIKDIMDSLGNFKHFLVEDYINGIKMLNLK